MNDQEFAKDTMNKIKIMQAYKINMAMMISTNTSGFLEHGVVSKII